MDHWVKDWFGYKRHISTINELDSIENRCAEIRWFRWIVSQLESKDDVNIVEVGAGYGPWSMALAGLRGKKKYKCLAIEANPEYVLLTRRHFEKQKINGDIVHSAISDYNGTCKFDTDFIPFGQSMTYTGRIKGSHFLAVVWGLLHTVSGSTANVRVETLDSLFNRLCLEHIDILQMDIQGAEEKAIIGAKNSLNKIEYMMIGTHHKEIHKNLIAMLSTSHRLIADIDPKKQSDGLQVWQLIR